MDKLPRNHMVTPDCGICYPSAQTLGIAGQSAGPPHSDSICQKWAQPYDLLATFL